MIRINLLPYRAARKKENIRIQVNVFVGSVVILIGIIFLYNSHLNGQIKRLNSDIESTKAQVEKYQQINKEITEIKQKLQILDRKINVIESLERDRKAPVQNLDSLYNLVVEKRMWYTQIEEKANLVKVSGIAIDNQTVADYMVKIEKSERFEKVRLSSIKQHKLQGKEINLKLFDIAFEKKNADAKMIKGKKQ
jgi:type IV pilus assembly protein PilN